MLVHQKCNVEDEPLLCREQDGKPHIDGKQGCLSLCLQFELIGNFGGDVLESDGRP